MGVIARWAAGGLVVVALGAAAFLVWWPAGAGASDPGAPEPGARDIAQEEEDGDEQHRLPFESRFGPHPHIGVHGPHGPDDEDFLADVALELGISEDELRSAIESVTADRIAARIQKQVEAGRLTQEEADELLEALERGTLDEALKERARERLEEWLADAVAAGRLSQERADELLEGFEDGALRHGPGDGPGWFPRFRRHFFGGSGQPDEPASTTTAGGI